MPKPRGKISTKIACLQHHSCSHLSLSSSRSCLCRTVFKRCDYDACTSSLMLHHQGTVYPKWLKLSLTFAIICICIFLLLNMSLYCHSLLQTQIYLFLVAYFFHSIISSTLFPPDNCKAYYLISFRSLSTCYLIREDLPDHPPYEKWQLPPALCFLFSFTLLYFSFFYLSPDIHVFFSPPSRIEAP